MKPSRLEAFSDGVIAIIITIMVLEFKAPETATWEAFKEIGPTFAGYFMSFLFVAIYWVNHHHLLHTVKRVTAGIMWANINLLFWLSLIPFATEWMSKNHFASNTTAIYAVLALLCGLSFTILQMAIVKKYPSNSELINVQVKNKWKTIYAILAYIAAIPFSYVHPYISCLLFISVSIIWLIPDKNIEDLMNEE